MNLFDTPAVGFEQPFEMLEACHDRVRRSLDLLARLVDHVQHQGHDARHVFPRVLAGGDAALRAVV